jgi:copper chaperone CopZ
MKTIFRSMMLKIFSLILVGTAVSCSSQAQTDTIKIKTSAQCSLCKERIETALAYEKGIKKSEVTIPGGECTVAYNKTKTTPTDIRNAIAKTGYDADSVAADPKAYAKLPACCKKPGDPSKAAH